MGTKDNTQEMTETRDFDLPQDGFRLKDHPWLAADITVEEMRSDMRWMRSGCKVL